MEEVEEKNLANAEQLEKLRKKVNQLIKKQKVRQVRHIVQGQDESRPWSQENQVKVSFSFHLLINKFSSCNAESTSIYGKLP